MLEQSEREERLHYMRLALEEAAKCEPVPTAFCVGCVITAPALGNDGTMTRKILSTGYSRELTGNTHAEANALAKAHALAGTEELGQAFGDGAELSTLLRLADVYTTLEPCSVRLSGLAPCADALVSAGVRNCIIGVKEPADFVQCEGTKKLQDAGINVIWLDDLEAECLTMARRGH
ncbi:diaminohydroxyphosphoribosylamino-pyrimidine deaminase [Rhizoctonia solani]|nr:diaminohydroxyphosphoribosylamino-pyrimidine deaminase [Rhizoctonia solani]